MLVSKVNMKFFRTTGAIAAGVVLGMLAAWPAPASAMQAKAGIAGRTVVAAATAEGQMKLTEPTAKQMRAVRKLLREHPKKRSKPVARPKVLAPKKFGGWTRNIVHAAKPEVHDAAAWKEFGWERGADANYTRGGDGLAVRVLKFQDATGAYGAFTLRRSAGMARLRIGTTKHARSALARSGHSRGRHAKARAVATPLTHFNGAHAGNRFLFWKGDLLVEANFARTVPDEVRVVNRLERALPATLGPKGIPPNLPEQLPREGLDTASVQYAIGPVAYRQEGGVLPAQVMDFNDDAEVVRARYGKGTLTLISYPTPEIAVARAAAIGGVIKSGGVPGPRAGQRVKRAGPLVAMTSGDLTRAQAEALLKQVRFEGTVALDQLKPQESEVAKTAQLLLGIAMLTLILGGTAILLGFFLGGGRALYRVLRGKPASSVLDEEFIKLNLNK